jgi:hypothetical protein
VFLISNDYHIISWFEMEPDATILLSSLNIETSSVEILVQEFSIVHEHL